MREREFGGWGGRDSDRDTDRERSVCLFGLERQGWGVAVRGGRRERERERERVKACVCQ
jgi:hypothetical protein